MLLCSANGICAICSIPTKNITTRLGRTYRCTRTRRSRVPSRLSASRWRCRFWAGYTTNISERKFPTGTIAKKYTNRGLQFLDLIQPPRRFHRGQERDPADRCRHPVDPATDHDAHARLAHAARGTRSPHALRHRHEQGPHPGRGGPAVLGDARAHPPDRGQGAKEAEAPEPVKDSQKLPR